IEENKPFAGYSIITDLLKDVVNNLDIVDNYMEDSSLEFFNVVNIKAKVRILTKRFKPNKGAFEAALKRFIQQWGGTNIEVK
ncbi:hypothetical protein IID22_03045, partial [Patescibacteria group bacterium]|nr:hypothetical protein [Patescibacteria group bacterium]